MLQQSQGDKWLWHHLVSSWRGKSGLCLQHFFCKQRRNGHVFCKIVCAFKTFDISSCTLHNSKLKLFLIKKTSCLYYQNIFLTSWWDFQESNSNNIFTTTTVKPIYLGRSKYLGSGWLYRKSKGTLRSPTSRDLSDSTVGSPLNSTRKKLQRPKLKKSQTAPWKWYFSPHDFLGLQQSLCNINFSFGIFMREYQSKNLLKCTMAIAESVKVVDFDGLFLTAIFA